MIPHSAFQEDYRKMQFPVHAICTNETQHWHWHEEFEILLSLKEHFILGLDQQFYTMPAGELVIIPGRHVHCILSPANASHFTLKFSHKLLRNTPEELSDFIASNTLSLFWEEPHKIYLRSLVQKLQTVFEGKQRGWQSELSCLLYAIQAYVIQNLPMKEDQSMLRSRRTSYQIHEILVYISRHYKDEHFSMPLCASHFHFNPNYFSTYFSQHTGLSFHKYVQSLRLREFEHLLLSTDSPISELCPRAGFSSVKTLNRLFQELWGMAPTQYRKTHRNRGSRNES